MRVGAVPGRGLVTSCRGGPETRPACHDAGLPGAGCPGRGSVVRDHEARDWTEPWAAGPLARAAVERRKASASPPPVALPARGRTTERQARAVGRKDRPRCLSAGPRNLPQRLSALRLPFICWRQGFRGVRQNSGRKNAQRENEIALFPSRPRARRRNGDLFSPLAPRGRRSCSLAEREKREPAEAPIALCTMEFK